MIVYDTITLFLKTMTHRSESHLGEKKKKKKSSDKQLATHGKNRTIFITTADLLCVQSHSDEAHALASTSPIYALYRLSQIGFCAYSIVT